MSYKRILITAEKKENALPLSLLLESHNFRVCMVEKDFQAIEKIRTHQAQLKPFDLLIAGTLMSGRALWKLFLELEKVDMNLPFIVVSDNNEAMLMKRLLDRGFYGYIVRPFDSIALLNSVINILGNISKYKKAMI
jgi:DNA-binding NtrC family response regulator